MNRRRIVRVLVVLGVGAGLVYVLLPMTMHAQPARIQWWYERRLNDYGRRLVAGDVVFVEGRGYGVPPYLIDKGAMGCSRKGDCYCVYFESMLDNPTPMLVYSPNGFEPVPPEIARLVSEPKAGWRQLSPHWAACEKPWWLNVWTK